jgi:hypothetical protein
MLKSYVLDGTIAAGASWTRLKTLMTPARTSRRLLEVRPYISATSGVRIRLGVGTDVIYELTAEEINNLKFPYPADVEIREGFELVLEAMNPTASAATVIVEVIVDETVSR